MVFTATVAPVLPGTAPTLATLTGGSTVTFKDGTTVLGTGTLVTGTSAVWTFGTSALTTGPHNITASFSGNARFIASVSNTIAQSVIQDGVYVTLTSSENPATAGDSVTFVATLASTTGGPPTGMVTFQDGFGGTVNPLGTVPLVTVGTASVTATYTTSALAAGLHGINVVYNGDANHNSGSAATLAETVNHGSTTVLVTSRNAPSVFGQPVTFQAIVTASIPGVLDGTVTFNENGAAIGTISLDGGGMATVTTATALSVGVHAITAVYNGNSTFDPNTGSTNQVVNKASTTTTVASSSNPAATGGAATYTATVTPVAPGAGMVAGTVTFSDGATILGTNNVGAGGIATVRASGLTDGTHAITATFSGDAHFGTSNGSLSESVNGSAVTIAVVSSLNPSPVGTPITFTANLTASSGTPTGTVTFSAGTTALGTATIDGSGNASVTTAALPIGTTTITASYGGDGFYPTGTGSLAQTIVEAATVTITPTSPSSSSGSTETTPPSSSSSSSSSSSGGGSSGAATSSGGTTPAASSSGGCSTTPSTRGDALASMFLAAIALVVSRRRRR